MERKLKIDLDYVEPNKSFVHPLYTEDGNIILPERVVLTEDKLKRIKRIYGHVVYHIEEASDPVPAPTPHGVIPKRYYTMAYEELQNIIGEITTTNKLSNTTFLRAERMIETLVSGLNSSEIRVINLLKEMKNYDEYIYQHLVNVGILSFLFAQKLGVFNSEEIKFITLGAYFIDIGLMKMDQQLLKKKGAYTGTDIQQIKRHPQLGYELLKDFDDIHPMVLQTVLLHHERFNNRGYYSLPYENLPYAPKIASICDIYDACTTQRPYREAYAPNKTLRVLLNAINRSFDQKLVTDFISFLWPLLKNPQSIYERDDFCVLNSNEIAVVADVNRQDILKPKVTIFCRYRMVNKSTVMHFYKRPVEVDLRIDVDRNLTKIITESSHIEYLKHKIVENNIPVLSL